MRVSQVMPRIPVLDNRALMGDFVFAAPRRQQRRLRLPRTTGTALLSGPSSAAVAHRGRDHQGASA